MKNKSESGTQAAIKRVQFKSTSSLIRKLEKKHESSRNLTDLFGNAMSSHTRKREIVTAELTETQQKAIDSCKKAREKNR